MKSLLICAFKHPGTTWDLRIIELLADHVFENQPEHRLSAVLVPPAIGESQVLAAEAFTRRYNGRLRVGPEKRTSQTGPFAELYEERNLSITTIPYLKEMREEQHVAAIGKGYRNVLTIEQLHAAAKEAEGRILKTFFRLPEHSSAFALADQALLELAYGNSNILPYRLEPPVLWRIRGGYDANKGSLEYDLIFV